MKILKHLTFILIGIILSLSVISCDDDDPVAEYQDTWEHKAHGYQRTLDMYAPLSQAIFLGTHNTFNSKVYTTLLRYIDPNHYHSIFEQLLMESRFIELDVHWYFDMKSVPWKNDLLLSHGQPNHLGASSFDRDFTEGLAEVQEWVEMPENKNELLLIMIQDEMDGHYNQAASEIEKYLGKYLYRPSDNSGQSIPMNITKADILATGKQIIIMSGSDDSTFNALAFKSSWSSSKPEGITAYPDCGSGRWSRDTYNSGWIRIFEDRTNLSAMFSDPGGKITTENIVEMMKCGVNLVNMDKLSPTDGRLKSAVWSWEVNEPNDYGDGEDAAIQKENGKWDDRALTNVYSYACKNPDTGAWFITQSSNGYDMGEFYCNLETAGKYFFATPINGYDNESLKKLKTVKGISNVWLNYNDIAEEGDWVITGKPEVIED